MAWAGPPEYPGFPPQSPTQQLSENLEAVFPEAWESHKDTIESIEDALRDKADEMLKDNLNPFNVGPTEVIVFFPTFHKHTGLGCHFLIFIEWPF
ncbi:MAG TPA: hypothetical protein DEF42_13055 [Desulfosporosinus sp.]|nr:hypothetical protein [Desulfosporosinus sp.]